MDIRPCLLGGGEQKSKSSPTSSRGQWWEVRWRPKSLPDDRANWGKRSARVRGVNPPKESKNGSVAWRLADCEETVELTSAGRNKQRRGDTFHWCGFLLPEEREKERSDRGTRSNPYFRSMMGGPRSAVWNWRDRNGLTGALLRPYPVIKV
jgi:hypothetical protein